MSEPELILEVFERSRDGMVFTDENGTIVKWNHRMELLTDLHKEDTIGKTIWDVYFNILPEFRQTDYVHETLRKQLSGLFHEGDTSWLNQSFYTTIRTPGGEKRNLKVIPILINTDNSAIIQLIVQATEENAAMGEASRLGNDSFQAIFRDAPVGVIIHHKGKIQLANPYALMVFNCNLEQEMKGINFLEFVHPSDKDRIRKEIYHEKKGEKSSQYEMSIIDRSGKVKYLEVTDAPFYYMGGSVYIITFADHTNRRNAEQALLNSEQKHKTTLDSIGDGIHLIDREYRIILMNKTLMEWHRHLDLPEHALGKPFFEIYPFLPLNITDEYDEVFTTGKIIKTVETNYFNGLEVSTETRKIPVYENGQITSIITIMRDISDQVKREEELKESEEKYRNVVERANDGIIIIQDLEVKFANRRIYELFGIERGQNENDQFLQLLNDKTRDILIENFTRRLDGDDVPSTYEINVTLKDNRIVPVELNAGIITFEGKPADLVLIRDITERKLVEEQIKSSLKEKEILLKEVHHRVKNNLQVVSSLLDLRRRTIKDTESHEIFRESQNRIKSIALIHEKLYNSGNLSEIDFGEYIGNLISSLLSTHNVDPERINVVVDAQEVHLEIGMAIPCAMIINELVTNSLKHGFPEGRSGVINISMKSDPEGTYFLTVSDNGIGLPKNFNHENPDCLGLQLVEMLIRQIHGGMKLNSLAGVSVEITCGKNKRNIQVSQ